MPAHFAHCGTVGSNKSSCLRNQKQIPRRPDLIRTHKTAAPSQDAACVERERERGRGREREREGGVRSEREAMGGGGG